MQKRNKLNRIILSIAVSDIHLQPGTFIPVPVRVNSFRKILICTTNLSNNG